VQAFGEGLEIRLAISLENQQDLALGGSEDRRICGRIG